MSAWHVPGLTGLRALAALWVLAHHFNAIVGWRPLHVGPDGWRLELTPLLTCGWVGVDIFFVLSGFLLTWQLLAAHDGDPSGQPERRYYLHRVLRVYPAYLVQIALLAIASLPAGGPSWSAWIPLHLAMAQGASAAGNAAINPVYWSLTVEFWFYGLLPFAVAWIRQAGRAAEPGRALVVFACATATAIGWRVAMFRLAGEGPPEILGWTFRQLPGALDLFSAGLLAAVACRARGSRTDARSHSLSGLLVLAGLGSLVGLMYLLHWTYETYWSGGFLLFTWQAFASVAVAVAVAGVAMNGRLSARLFGNGPARFLGDVSYGIYLWHFPVALAVARVLPPAQGEGTFLMAALVATLAVSAASYYAIERPVLARRGAWERRLGLVA